MFFYVSFVLLSKNKSKVRHQHIPDGNDMAYGASKDEEMEDGVHVFLLVQRVEYGTRDIADAFGHNPDKGLCGD